jgi:hypothetical protein
LEDGKAFGPPSGAAKKRTIKMLVGYKIGKKARAPGGIRSKAKVDRKRDMAASSVVALAAVEVWAQK